MSAGRESEREGGRERETERKQGMRTAKVEY